MLTEDEARSLNELSARVAALEVMVTWLLYDYLNRSADVDADLLIEKATAFEAPADKTELLTEYRRRVETLVRSAERLLRRAD